MSCRHAIRPAAVVATFIPRRSSALSLAITAMLLGNLPTAQAQTIEEIVVRADGSQVLLPDAYAGGQVARGGRMGMLGNLDMMDAPFNLSSFTQELILDQQAVSVGDVLQNDPTVRVATGFGNFQELYMIRGFPVYSDDMTYNGVYGILPRQFVAAELLERVEVFRGASAFLNGAAPGGSSLGGTVNLVPKRAPDEPLNRLTTGIESGGHGFVAVDVARRFGTGDSSGIRVNAVKRGGETSIDDQDRELSVLAVGLDHNGDRLRLTADFGYQDHVIDRPRPSVTPQITTQAAIPDAPSADSNFGQPWTYTDEQQLFGALRGEYFVSDNISVWLAAGMRDGEETNLLANPDVWADGTLNANRFDNVREDEVLSGEAGLRSEFSSGPVGHTLTFSTSVFSSESANAYAFSDFSGVPVGSLEDPQAVVPPVADALIGGALDNPRVTEKVETSSLAVADMLSFLDERLLITLGARHQTIETRSFDYNTGAQLSGYDESRVTPMGGIVYKPLDSVSLYANYIEGLLPGEVAPANSGGEPVLNAGEVFDPYQAEQVEVGIKYDGGNLGGSVSAFTTQRPQSYVEDGLFAPQGEQRNRGIELSLFGEPLEQLRLIGGLTWLDAELVDTQGGIFDGNDAVGSPEFQLNINGEWDFLALPGLTLEGRFIHTGSQYADQANTVEVDDWSRIDLGLRYDTVWQDRALMLRFRVQNATDEDHWTSVGGFPGANYLVLGAPRTLMLSASLDF